MRTRTMRDGQKVWQFNEGKVTTPHKVSIKQYQCISCGKQASRMVNEEACCDSLDCEYSAQLI